CAGAVRDAGCGSVFVGRDGGEGHFGRHLGTGRDVVLDDAGGRGAERVLHLHGLDDQDRVTGLDAVAVGGGQGDDGAGHRRGQRAVAGAVVVGGGADDVLAAEHPGALVGGDDEVGAAGRPDDLDLPVAGEAVAVDAPLVAVAMDGGRVVAGLRGVLGVRRGGNAGDLRVDGDR